MKLKPNEKQRKHLLEFIEQGLPETSISFIEAKDLSDNEKEILHDVALLGNVQHCFGHYSQHTIESIVGEDDASIFFDPTCRKIRHAKIPRILEERLIEAISLGLVNLTAIEERINEIGVTHFQKLASKIINQ